MAWIMNEYAKFHGFHPACVTGKPVEFHGSAGREAATGYGVALIAREMLGELGRDDRRHDLRHPGLRQRRQLHRPVPPPAGRQDRRRLRRLRRRCINPEGIDIPALDKHVAANRKVVGFKGGDATTNEQLLTMPVDVLIPAALGGVFDATMAEAVQAKIIVEAANGPTWPEADEVFNERGIPVVPDILANAGGVIVSYFEWVQNLQHFRWQPGDVNGRIAVTLGETYAEMADRSEANGVSLRDTAYDIAIERVIEAAVARGPLPARRLTAERAAGHPLAGRRTTRRRRGRSRRSPGSWARRAGGRWRPATAPARA